MPFTPYHFGPGLLFKGIFPKRFSWSSFAVAQIVIDSEVLYFIFKQQFPLHRTLHTLLGASFAGVFASFIVLGLYLLIEKLTAFSTTLTYRKLALIRTELSTTNGVFIGGITGGLSHALFDSLIYSDVYLFWPFSDANPFLGFINSFTLVTGMMVAGLIGIILATIWLFSDNRAG